MKKLALLISPAYPLNKGWAVDKLFSSPPPTESACEIDAASIVRFQRRSEGGLDLGQERQYIFDQQCQPCCEKIFHAC